MTEVRKVSRRHKTPRPRDRSSRRQERGHQRLEAEADSKSAASSTRPPAGAEVETNETNGRRERDKWNIDPSKYTYFILLLVKVTVSFHLIVDEIFLLDTEFTKKSQIFLCQDGTPPTARVTRAPCRPVAGAWLSPAAGTSPSTAQLTRSQTPASSPSWRPR